MRRRCQGELSLSSETPAPVIVILDVATYVAAAQRERAAVGAEAELAAAGRCQQCGRKLTGRQSLQAGIGPGCQAGAQGGNHGN